MTYEIRFVEGVEQDLNRLYKSEPSAYRKALSLIAELQEHPRTGTGHPEPLKNGDGEQWSRRITKKHRLVYEILEREILILVLSAYGHYDDK